MNKIAPIFSALLLGSLGLTSVSAQSAPPEPSPQVLAETAKYASLKNEMRRAIERGNEFLQTKQNAEGFWTSPEYPAMTALALTAYMRSPQNDGKAPWPDYITKGYAWLLKQQKADGGIYTKTLASYNTAISLTALLAADKPDWIPQILKARAFVVDQQSDFGIKGKVDTPFDGGIGYGGKEKPHETSDLSNTAFALEALHLSRHLVEDGKNGKQPDLNWDAALEFISRCQNSPKTNDQPWAQVVEPAHEGGFVYDPQSSKADEQKNKDAVKQVTPLRSYGSISYAGLQSLIYARLDKNDPRVKSVLKWLSQNYTLDQNPGMGNSGLYYYYQAMAKALGAAGIDVLDTADNQHIDWRMQLGNQLMKIQRPDGSWVNSDNRWWETDPVLVTSYSILALEQIYNTLP